MMRGSPDCVRIRPKVPELKFVTGVPQLKVLNRLNVSILSSSVCAAPSDRSRDTDRSTVQYPGPSMLFLRRLPSVPAAGMPNAAAFR